MTTTQETADRPRPGAWGWLLLVTLWLALVGGLMTLAGLAAARFLLHRLVHNSVDIAWMAPLSFLLLLAPAALLMLPFAVRSTRAGTWCAGGLGTLTAWGIALNIPGIHPLAALLLGIGAGYRGAIAVRQDPAASRRFLLRTLPGLAAISVLLGAALPAARSLAEHRRLAGLPPAARSDPNVLLIVLDTQRAMSMSAYGYDRPTTPRLASVAADGVRFTRAFSTAPWTLASHGSIMTGHWVHELSIGWTRPLDATYPTLAEVLARRGYATAGFTANILNTGTGTGIERGFLHYEDYPTSFSGIVASTVLGARVVEFTRKRFRRPRSEQWGRKTAPEVSAEFLGWERHHRERPFFAFLNYFDAHDPYPAPAPFDSLFGLPRDRESPNLNDLEWRGWPPEQFAIQRGAYEATIAYVDRTLGALMDALRRDGRLDNTILIITSDHGEEFHEHRLMGHGNSLYRPALQVPLVLRFPARLPAGAIIPTPVSLRDLPATIMDLIGSPDPEPFPGRTLLRYLEAAPEGAPEPLYNWVDAEPIQPDWFPVAHGPLKGVILGDHRYMVDARGREEFYSLADTLEQHDLSRDSTLADRIALYRRLAAAQVRSSGSEAAATTDNQP